MKHRLPAKRSLDDIDVRILKRLELDARISYAELANHVGAAASTCHHRVKRLEETGVIRRYIADIDESLLGGLLLFWGEFLLTPTGRASRKQLEEALASAAEIVEAHEIAGRSDYIVRVGGADPSVWPRTLERIDPDGRLIATSNVQSGIRQTKRFSGLSHL